MRHERFTPGMVADVVLDRGARLALSAPRRAVWAALLPQRRSALVRFAFGLAAAVADVAAIVGTAALGEALYGLFATGVPAGPGLAVWAAGLVALFLAVPNAARGDYAVENYLAFASHPRRVARLWLAASILVLALGFATKTTGEYSRILGVASFLAGLPVLLAVRLAMVRLASGSGIVGAASARRVHLVGYEEDVAAFHAHHDPARVGLRVVGTSLLRRAAPGSDPRQGAAQGEEDLALAVSVVRFLRPDDVLVLLPWASGDEVERCVNAFLSVPVALHLRPEQVMGRFADLHVGRAGELTGLHVGRRPLGALEVGAKRAFDVLVASVALALLAPLLGTLALLIRLEDGGPALFVQRRYGFNQQPFRVLKFRSMRVEAGGGFRQATRGDDRVTRIGRILRRWNLDELPQLWNVVRGDMSLVGPRPHAVAHDQSFERRIALYARRHNVKPGITGWAQINGYRGETRTEAAMRGRVEHDHHYIDHWSFWLDLRILAATVLSPKAYRNAY